MRSTGIVRKMDPLNRIVIPRELCKTMDLQEGTAIEILTDGNRIVIQKYERGCCLCGEVHDDLVTQAGKGFCPSCIKGLAKQAKLDQMVAAR